MSAPGPEGPAASTVAGVVAPVVVARTAAQLSASLAAESVQLPPEIRQALDDVSAPAVGYPERTSRWTSEDLED